MKFTAHDAQYRNIGKSNNLEVLGNNKPKGLNRIAKIGERNRCSRKENLKL